MIYLKYDEVVYKDLLKFKDKCGSSDYVVFLQCSGVTDLMFYENKPLGYMGLDVIENDEIVESVFLQYEGDFDNLKEHFNFNWDMSPEEKAEILLNYV